MHQQISMRKCPPFAICFCARTNVFIGWVIGAPSHSKYLVYRLNACEKNLQQYTKHINQPHEVDKDRSIKHTWFIFKKILACWWMYKTLFGRTRIWIKGVIKHKNGVTRNNKAKTLSCDRFLWQTNSQKFDVPTYFIDIYKKTIRCIQGFLGTTTSTVIH